MEVIGYTTGVYDLFHIGHLNILKKAKENCDKLVVGVTTDELCKSRKGYEPFIGFEERIEIVRSLKFVDLAVPQETMDKFIMWELYKFNRMFVGDDWKGTPTWNHYEEQFQKVGVQILYFPYTKETSSTILREALIKINSGVSVV